MPILEEPHDPRTVTLPPRRARHGGRCDVLVVGGGPAGFAAAVGAADTGADTVLVERYGFLGGNATVALVMPLMSFHNEHKQAAFTEAGEAADGAALASGQLAQSSRRSRFSGARRWARDSFSSWRTRSRVRPTCWATCCRVRGRPSCSP